MGTVASLARCRQPATACLCFAPSPRLCSRSVCRPVCRPATADGRVRVAGAPRGGRFCGFCCTYSLKSFLRLKKSLSTQKSRTDTFDLGTTMASSGVLLMIPFEDAAGLTLRQRRGGGRTARRGPAPAERTVCFRWKHLYLASGILPFGRQRKMAWRPCKVCHGPRSPVTALRIQRTVEKQEPVFPAALPPSPWWGRCLAHRPFLSWWAAPPLFLLILSVSVCPAVSGAVPLKGEGRGVVRLVAGLAWSRALVVPLPPERSREGWPPCGARGWLTAGRLRGASGVCWVRGCPG